MIRFLFTVITLAYLPLFSNEVEEFLHTLPPPSLAEATRMVEKTADLSPAAHKKCSFKTSFSENVFSQEDSAHRLLLFTSFSLPLESWKEHSHALEKTGGFFVVRGLPQNSFTHFAQKIIELRQAGVYAEILLDPESFEKFDIEMVPTLVLTNGPKYDKVSGNLKLPIALSLFAQRGDIQAIAKQFLKKMEAN
jgi:conjugal transfer pilus assembly protein TrbC